MINNDADKVYLVNSNWAILILVYIITYSSM